MHAWLDVDSQGRQYLVRTGTGVVTAVTPVGPPQVEGDHPMARLEIYCDAPHGRPGSIRYSAHPLIPTGHALHRVALEALDEVWPVCWTVAWHRHDWIPDGLPITSLDLTTDARALLTGLTPVLLPEPLAEGLPDFVPLSWSRDGHGT